MSWWKRWWWRISRRRLIFVHQPFWESNRPELFLRNQEELNLRFVLNRELLVDADRHSLATEIAKEAEVVTYNAVMGYGT